MRGAAAACRASPLGLRRFEEERWASLRLAAFSAFTALSYASLPDTVPAQVWKARCLARAQLGYIVGDTGRSYVVGYGRRFPQQVHHRDAACTLQEDEDGFCQRCDTFPPVPRTLHVLCQPVGAVLP